MRLVIAIIVIVVERFFNLTVSLPRDKWFKKYFAYAEDWFSGFNASVRQVIIILLPIIVASIIYEVFGDILFGLFGLIIGVILLWLSMGSNDLFDDINHYIDADELGETDASAAYAQKLAGEGQSTAQADIVAGALQQFNKSIFTPLFWFAILGPLAALAYRLIADLAEREAEPSYNQNIKRVLGWIEWLPVRLVTLFYALGGHFMDSFIVWQGYLLAGHSDNDSFLYEAGSAALALEADTSQQEAVAKCLQLLDRALIMGIVVLALVVIF